MLDIRNSMNARPEPESAAELSAVQGRYFNRELSWLAFNQRVLAEAGNLT